MQVLIDIRLQKIEFLESIGNHSSVEIKDKRTNPWLILRSFSLVIIRSIAKTLDGRGLQDHITQDAQPQAECIAVDLPSCPAFFFSSACVLTVESFVISCWCSGAKILSQRDMEDQDLHVICSSYSLVETTTITLDEKIFMENWIISFTSCFLIFTWLCSWF